MLNQLEHNLKKCFLINRFSGVIHYPHKFLLTKRIVFEIGNVTYDISFLLSMYWKKQQQQIFQKSNTHKNDTYLTFKQTNSYQETHLNDICNFFFRKLFFLSFCEYKYIVFERYFNETQELSFFLYTKLKDILKVTTFDKIRYRMEKKSNG